MEYERNIEALFLHSFLELQERLNVIDKRLQSILISNEIKPFAKLMSKSTHRFCVSLTGDEMRKFFLQSDAVF